MSTVSKTPAPPPLRATPKCRDGRIPVIIFDIGPQRPQEPPERPAVLDLPNPPPHHEGDARIEPETRRYAEACRHYRAELEAFPIERARWERSCGGGAIEIACNSASGREMVERGRGRYVTALPPDVRLGSLSGMNRVKHSVEIGAHGPRSGAVRITHS
jgi:hypothetical protein